MLKTLHVDIWSDIACPWCYIGKRRFEAALALFPHRDAVRVAWRAFELDPAAPGRRDRTVSHAGRIAAKYGVPVAEAERMTQRVTDAAAADGLDFHFEKIESGNTFDAHRLVHLGAERGLGDAVKERFLRGYFTEGECMGDHDALIRLGAEVGLDAGEARQVLLGDRYATEVRADEATAAELGITGVPFFVIGGRYGISGAQPAKTLLGALEKAWSELGSGAEELVEGAACGPAGCA